MNFRNNIVLVHEHLWCLWDIANGLLQCTIHIGIKATTSTIKSLLIIAYVCKCAAYCNNNYYYACN